MYFKENRQSMAEKEPAFGHVDMFQTSLNLPLLQDEFSFKLLVLDFVAAF